MEQTKTAPREYPRGNNRFSGDARMRVLDSLQEVFLKGQSRAGYLAMTEGHGPYAEIYAREQARLAAAPKVKSGFFEGMEEVTDPEPPAYNTLAGITAAMSAQDLKYPRPAVELLASEGPGLMQALGLGYAQGPDEAGCLAAVMESYLWGMVDGRPTAGGHHSAEILASEVAHGVDRTEEIAALYETGDASAWMAVVRALPDGKHAGLLFPPTFRFHYALIFTSGTEPDQPAVVVEPADAAENQS